MIKMKLERENEMAELSIKSVKFEERIQEGKKRKKLIYILFRYSFPLNGFT